jgi:DNA repair protein RecO
VAYATYTTEAIVCGASPLKEHDLTLRLLTRDAGMIYARVTGARADVSKLRYGLQEFSYARVTLVRGRADWRVTGVVAISNFYFDAQTRSARASLLSAMRSLRRLIHGSEMHAELFDVVLDGLTALAKSGDVRGDSLFLLRLLHHLGYVSPLPAYAHLLHTETLTEACALYGTEPLTPTVQRAIEHALTVSHL